MLFTNIKNVLQYMKYDIIQDIHNKKEDNMNSIRDTILNIIVMIPGMLIAFTFHEYAHAYVADRLGDKTPRFQGRLTLNPIAHKNYYKDDLKVSLAGPIANFMVAVVTALIWGFYRKFLGGLVPEVLNIVLQSMIYMTLVINVNIGLFNLIPIPGLDGFSLLRDLSPNTFHRFEEQFYQYQMIIMLALIFVGGRIIQIPSGIILKGLLSLSSLVMNLF
jgi:Zn-dependent protease